MCLHLWYEAVQLSVSVPVRRVCGQPLREGGLSSQLVSDFHLLPEYGTCSHICTGLRKTHTPPPMESEKHTRSKCGLPLACAMKILMDESSEFSLVGQQCPLVLYRQITRFDSSSYIRRV